MSANGKIKVIFEKDKNGLFKSFSIESPFKPDKEKEQEPKTYKTFKDVTFGYFSSIGPFFAKIPELMNNVNFDLYMETAFRVRPFVENIGDLIEETPAKDIFEIDPTRFMDFTKGLQKIDNHINVAKRGTRFLFYGPSQSL